jgi:hypothetical protein
LLLSKLIKSNLDGDLPNDQLRAIVTALNCLLASLEKSEFEQRLCALEEKINDYQGKN